MMNIAQNRKSVLTVFGYFSLPKSDFVSKIIVLVLPFVESDVNNVANKMLNMHSLQLFLKMHLRLKTCFFTVHAKEGKS